MELKEAILSLDPKKDEVWTENGLPKIEVIKELTGKSFSRKEITDAAPLHTRERLLRGESTDVKPASADQAADPEVKTQAPEAEVKEEPQVSELEQLEEELASIGQRLDGYYQARKELNQAIGDLESRKDYVSTRLDEIKPKETLTDAIQQMLERSKEERIARAERGERSPLDQRLAARGRNPRPSMNR